MEIQTALKLPMDPHEAFDLTLRQFKIKAVDIALRTGKKESYISQFRHGTKDIAASTLVEIIRTLPMPAQMYFWGLCMSCEDATSSKQKIVA